MKHDVLLSLCYKINKIITHTYFNRGIKAKNVVPWTASVVISSKFPIKRLRRPPNNQHRGW